MLRVHSLVNNLVLRAMVQVLEVGLPVQSHNLQLPRP